MRGSYGISAIIGLLAIYTSTIADFPSGMRMPKRVALLFVVPVLDTLRLITDAHDAWWTLALRG